jgi:hypothetical protein
VTDLLDNWQPETKVQEADTVLNFITRYFEIHRKSPALRECCDGTHLNEYCVKRAIARLRRQNRLSHTSPRPVQKATLERWYKQKDDSNADAD